MEMGSMNGQTGSAYTPSAGRRPVAILEECSAINDSIGTIEKNLGELYTAQDNVLADPDSSVNASTNHKLDKKAAETMSLYKNLGGRIKALKQQKESGDPRYSAQVGMVDRKLRNAIGQYQQIDRDFRHKLSAQIERQYRIVRPNASDQEVREAIEDTSSNQVFSQAVRVNHHRFEQNQLTDALAYDKQSTRSCIVCSTSRK